MYVELNIKNMENRKLLNDGTNGLVSIMETLSECNHNVSVVFHKINGDSADMEDDFDFIEAQRAIHSAIKQIGQILGNKIAESFY